jgi:hypothetical protein
VSGWGGGPWGLVPWGGIGIATLQLANALAIRDNVVRLTFNTAPLFTRIYNAGDAANIERYAVVPDALTVGADGSPPRPVFPATIERAAVAGSAGTILDLTVDRSFSPWPSVYRVACNGLQAITGQLLDPAAASMTFYGLSRGFMQPRIDLAVSAKDIANPQNRAGMMDPLPNTKDNEILGTIPVDAQGDIAFDDGIDSYRKRIFRRCMTRKGAFAWMPDYGVGVPEQVKRLATPGTRDSLAAEAESQIRQEPETRDVDARFQQDKDVPTLFWLTVRAVTTYSTKPIAVNVPFDATL